MPKKKTAAKASASKRTNRKPTQKARNPFPFQKKAKRPRRSNGSGSTGDKIRPVQMVKEGAIILSGLVTARQLPQLALGAKNTGPLGYAANFGIAALGGIILGMFTNARMGFMFAAGGTAYTLSRVATEQLSPVGRYFALSGVGDASAASVGDVRRAGVGIVVDSSYNEPLLRTPGGQLLIPPHISRFVDGQISASRPVMAQPTMGRFAR